MHVGDDIMPFCGGSLISSKTVVTSASCLSGEKINRYESLASSMTCITIATCLISQFQLHQYRWLRDKYHCSNDLGLNDCYQIMYLISTGKKCNKAIQSVQRTNEKMV